MWKNVLLMLDTLLDILWFPPGTLDSASVVNFSCVDMESLEVEVDICRSDPLMVFLELLEDLLLELLTVTSMPISDERRMRGAGLVRIPVQKDFNKDHFVT